MPRSNERFARSLNRWWIRQQNAVGDSPASGETPLGEGSAVHEEAWRRDRTVEALATELRRDVQFEFAQVGFLHRRPDLQAATAAIDDLVPPPTPEDRTVLAEAIVRAGSTAQKVRVTTAAGAVLTVLALVLRNVLRGR